MTKGHIEENIVSWEGTGRRKEGFYEGGKSYVTVNAKLNACV